MRFFASGFAAAIAIVVTAGCSGGGMGAAPAPISAGAGTTTSGTGAGTTMSASRTTFAVSSGAASTHDLPSSGGFGGSVTLPATNAPAGATMTIDASTTQPDGVVIPQAAQRQPLDLGGASVLFFLTFTPSTTITLNGFPSFSVVVPQTKHAAAQFFLALSAPAVSGVQAQFQTLGPAGDDGTTLHFTGFTDTLTLKAGTQYTFALYGLEQETRPAGVFNPLFTGDKRAALDVTQATSEFTAATNTFTFSAMTSGPIQSGQDNYFAWGINRGGAPAGPFGLEPNVQFNAIVLVEAEAEGGINAMITLGRGTTPTQLPTSDVQINGAKIMVNIPASSLPSTGAQPAGYFWNLWTQDQQQSVDGHNAKFIPENAVAPFLPGAEAAAAM